MHGAWIALSSVIIAFGIYDTIQLYLKYHAVSHKFVHHIHYIRQLTI